MQVKPVVLALTVVVALCAAATASANSPTRTPVPPIADNIDPACGFDVLVDFVESEWNVVSSTFSNAASPVVEIDTGVAKVQLTNLETGKTIAVNISGPQIVKVFSDGSVVIAEEGPWIHHNVPGLPGIFQTRGRVTITIDAAGNVTIDGNGRLVDLCAALAA